MSDRAYGEDGQILISEAKAESIPLPKLVSSTRTPTSADPMTATPARNKPPRTRSVQARPSILFGFQPGPKVEQRQGQQYRQGPGQGPGGEELEDAIPGRETREMPERQENAGEPPDTKGQQGRRRPEHPGGVLAQLGRSRLDCRRHRQPRRTWSR